MLRTYALGLEAPEHENVQFLTMKPSHDESSVYEYWDGLGTDPRCQVIVMGASNHAMPANLENSAVATGLEKVSFHSNPKERQYQRMLILCLL